MFSNLLEQLKFSEDFVDLSFIACPEVLRRCGKQYYRQAAEAGDTCAMANYARCLQNGIGVEMDLEEAFKYVMNSLNFVLGNKWRDIFECSPWTIIV